MTLSLLFPSIDFTTNPLPHFLPGFFDLSTIFMVLVCLPSFSLVFVDTEGAKTQLVLKQSCILTQHAHSKGQVTGIHELHYTHLFHPLLYSFFNVAQKAVKQQKHSDNVKNMPLS